MTFSTVMIGEVYAFTSDVDQSSILQVQISPLGIKINNEQLKKDQVAAYLMKKSFKRTHLSANINVDSKTKVRDLLEVLELLKDAGFDDSKITQLADHEQAVE